jgi:predicted lipoprotein with Yx(FWY)xxD motif
MTACIYRVNVMKSGNLVILIAVIVTAFLIAGCTQTQPVQPTQQPTAVPTVKPADTVKTADTALGKIIVDAQGKTLYYFANDIAANGTSACNGQCAGIWPPFNTSVIQVSAPLDPADFASITRADGTKQTTYYGWPLYYYSGDKNPGDTNGENFLKIWFVIKPDESVLISHSLTLGLFMTDTSGKTLYYFTKDTPGQSACTGNCSKLWPPFGANPVTAPSVLDTANFSQVTRSDGINQTAFMGRPLYYYSADTKPGNVNGEGFINLWYVANISGIVPAVTTPAPTTTTVPPTAKPATSIPVYSSGY